MSRLHAGLAFAATWSVGSAAGPQQTRLRITSACDKEPMWIAHEAGPGVGPDPQNVKLMPLESHDFMVYDNLKATRYWPMFRCEEGGGNCQLGGSGGPGQVCDPKIGCAPPIDSKFEATFGQVGQPCNTSWPPGEYAGCDWLDVSFVDGFTVPFKLDINGDCTARFANVTGHKTVDCSKISVKSCPVQEDLGKAGAGVNLQAVHPTTGDVVGCYSPCSKLTFRNWNNDIAMHHTPQDDVAKDYCCPTPPESPEACRAGPVKDTQFVQAVHHMCPGVYGYSYDDGVGLLTCPAGTTYEMTFYCPESAEPFNVTTTTTTTSNQPGPPGPGGKCKVGDSVTCPGASAMCAGDSCCPDGSTCPSADSSFKGCPQAKTTDCTKEEDLELVVI